MSKTGDNSQQAAESISQFGRQERERAAHYEHKISQAEGARQSTQRNHDGRSH